MASERERTLDRALQILEELPTEAYMYEQEHGSDAAVDRALRSIEDAERHLAAALATLRTSERGRELLSLRYVNARGRTVR